MKQNIYFIGIGGIGMSALARYFKFVGKNVAGYDKTPTQLTQQLENEGIKIHFEDNLSKIETNFLNPAETLVVLTPAVPKNHSEFVYFQENNFEILKRAEVLGLITQHTFCLAVAGTHGKTTTSSILSHLLHESGADVTGFLGGIVENYNSNLVGQGKSISVVEADEFDRSFLHLHPNVACITSMDADHLDIYGNSNSIEESFKEFASKITNKTNLFIAEHLNIEGIKVGMSNTSAYHPINLRIENGWYLFDAVTPFETIKNLKFGLPGQHNLTNALMAIAMAKKIDIPNDKIKTALASFKGVKRRFSFVIREENLVYIDDYAHHPTEINAVHQAVRELYPNEKVIAIFQPHLFSRTHDFLDDFANSLSQFDEVILLEIYPARELPIEGVNSSVLLEKISNKNKVLIGKNNLINHLASVQSKIFITIGAGDIGEMVNDIASSLRLKKTNTLEVPLSIK